MLLQIAYEMLRAIVTSSKENGSVQGGMRQQPLFDRLELPDVLRGNVKKESQLLDGEAK